MKMNYLGNSFAFYVKGFYSYTWISPCPNWKTLHKGSWHGEGDTLCSIKRRVTHQSLNTRGSHKYTVVLFPLFHSIFLHMLLWVGKEFLKSPKQWFIVVVKRVTALEGKLKMFIIPPSPIAVKLKTDARIGQCLSNNCSSGIPWLTTKSRQANRWQVPPWLCQMPATSCIQDIQPPNCFPSCRLSQNILWNVSSLFSHYFSYIQ